MSLDSESNDWRYMAMAIQQANQSVPVETAYCVGCVIVQNGVVLSSGFSRELPGNTHAEECALKKLTPEQAQGATVYTTMEPCTTRLSGNVCCTDHIINNRIARVVIGVREPAEFVVCIGIDRLEKAGIQVTRLSGLELECLQPNKHIPSVAAQIADLELRR